MSNLKNARIKSYIEQNFSELIDLSSINGNDRPAALLTRGIAGLALMAFTGCGFQDAANSIVDGGGDNGIDAIYYDSYTNAVYFVQSKWSGDGKKTIDEAAAHKLKHGVQKLLDLDFEGFNENIKKKKSILDKITNDASVKIFLCPAYNSNNALSNSVKSILSEYISSINDGDDIMCLSVANQSKIYEVASKTRGPVNEDVVIRNWTKIVNNKPLYYGQIAASDLAALFEKHQDSLFIPNIRAFKGDTDVNNMIVESILNSPEIFCYLNNGITVIANKINKKPLGGASRESGIFECKGLSVVNGAQTVGACNRAYRLDIEKTNLAYVMAKFIETEQQDNDLAIAITKAANTQNKIERKDFVALDPFQKELKEGLDILGIQYIYKTGEEIQKKENCVDLTYVMQALIADTGEMALIATAKREIGKLWDDINNPPYKTIFNPSNNPYYVKNIIMLFAEIQKIIKSCSASDKRKIQYATYGNVFIASQCLSKIERNNIKSEKYDLAATLQHINRITPTIFSQIYIKFEEKYPGTPLVYLFRNAKKLKDVESELLQNES